MALITQGYRNCRYHTSNLSLSVSGLQQKPLYLALFPSYIATFAVHETVRDLEKSFLFDKAVRITSHVRSAVYT